MHNKLIIILSLLVLALNIHAESQAQMDSLKAAINKEAEVPNFIHAYIMSVTPGKAYYSAFGHEAIRMQCPSKGLDYCFSFEMNMSASSHLDVFLRKAKAGFNIMESRDFISLYQKEGRGIQAYELNLNAKEKQNLWKVLDENVANGSTWTFDYLSVNCLSMVFYAINSAIQPSQLVFEQLPSQTRLDIGEWLDYINRCSPWLNLILHTELLYTDVSHVSQEEKIVPEMLPEILPKARIFTEGQAPRNLVKGKPTILLTANYQDKPYWFRPWMALLLVIGITIILIGLWYNKNKKKRRY